MTQIAQQKISEFLHLGTLHPPLTRKMVPVYIFYKVTAFDSTGVGVVSQSRKILEKNCYLAQGLTLGISSRQNSELLFLWYPLPWGDGHTENVTPARKALQNPYPQLHKVGTMLENLPSVAQKLAKKVPSSS